MSAQLHSTAEPTRPGVGRGPWGALLALPVLALIIPASLVPIGPLQSNGWPARLLVFYIAAATILGWLGRRRPTRYAPAEVGSWLLILGLATAWSASTLRELTQIEASGALRFALVLIPLAIVCVFISSTATARQCDLLLGSLLLGVLGTTLVGIAQSLIPFQWDAVLRLPGFVASETLATGSRGGFLRVIGAADHAIEYGVITAAAVPLALHFARFAAGRRTRIAAGVLTVLLLASIPLSVSRSGVLVVLIAVGLYAVTLNMRQRVTALVLALAGMLLFRAAIPGLLGTVLSIFRGVGTDDSISGRTEDYSEVYALWQSQPVLGYGLGTFRPEDYFFLDNQYLMALVEGGIVLLVVTILWFLLALASARGAVLRSRSPLERSRAQAVLAAVASIGVSGAFFDLFSFAQVTIMVFLLVGIAGALWRHGIVNGTPVPTPWHRLGLGRPAAPRPRTGARRGPTG